MPQQMALRIPCEETKENRSASRREASETEYILLQDNEWCGLVKALKVNH